jgi:hypothetical protein
VQPQATYVPHNVLVQVKQPWKALLQRGYKDTSTSSSSTFFFLNHNPEELLQEISWVAFKPFAHEKSFLLNYMGPKNNLVIPERASESDSMISVTLSDENSQ